MKAPKKSDESKLNRAYGWFAFLGIATLPIGVGLFLSVTHWMNDSDLLVWEEIFGLTLAAPLLAGMVWALIYGIWQTVRFRHAALVVLSAISIVFVGGLIVLVPNTPGWNGGTDLPIVDYGFSTAFGIYSAANILIPAWWFTRGRRQYRAKSLAQH